MLLRIVNKLILLVWDVDTTALSSGYANLILNYPPKCATLKSTTIKLLTRKLKLLTKMLSLAQRFRRVVILAILKLIVKIINCLRMMLGRQS